MRKFIKTFVRADGSSLFGRALSAGFWASAWRMTLRLSTIIRTVILARILAPEDFGLMAIAAISISLLERFTQSGFEAALVQRTDDIEPYLDTAWTFQIMRALVMSGTLVVAAPWIARFFGAPEATEIIRVLAIAVAIAGFANIAVVRFVKELRFDKQFILQLGSKGTDIIVSIGAALILRSVWALVLGVLSGAAGRVIASYVIDDYRPRIRWVRHQFKHLFGFGKWITASQILNYVSENLDDILVGRILGIQSLGWYRMAYNFSQAVATEVESVTSQVAFPTYSKLQGAADKLRVAFMGSVHFVAFLGFPIAIGTALIAPDLTYGLLGDKWAPIIVPMQLLSIAGLFRGISATASPLFRSQGQPSIPPRFGLANIGIMAVLLYPAINAFGINGAAGAVLIAGVIPSIFELQLAFSRVHATRREMLQALAFPALNGAAMATVVLALRFAFFEDPNVVSLAVLTVSGTLAYLGAVFLSTKMLGYCAPTDLLKRIQQASP